MTHEADKIKIEIDTILESIRLSWIDVAESRDAIGARKEIDNLIVRLTDAVERWDKANA